MLIVAKEMLHTEGDLAPGWLNISGSTISDAGRGTPPQALLSASEVVHADILSPGFVDAHCHGGAGGSFSDGDPHTSLAALRAHRQRGTTSTVASVVTDRVPALAQQLQALADLVDQGELVGVHLEGPWLSPLHAGAHAPHLLCDPNARDVHTLLDAARGTLAMVTLAPELPGGMEAITLLRDQGVLVAIGHTDADSRVTGEAADAGASVVTHLFNAMRPVHHREPGPIVAALNDDRLLIELIADGQHLDPAVLLLAARSARGGFSLVTDAMAAALAPPGRYRLGELDVDVGADLVPRLAGTERIAGSTLTMDRAVATMAAAGLPLASVLAAASTVPAARLGLDNVGRLIPGCRGDLVLLSPALGIQAVMRAGEWVE